ncbi:ROK family transcriptional regulator [Roseivivax isoporae]|uniref:ROK family transcriptional regulator n=1 Tax=Roseivivax isoporae LMG 25204 TaxID=1449351 RepID=X7F7B3_9RHOB|nr:ROK family transcriptional regulator [Roseivivax isoporae]ETX27959.1 ROK family transcriptional regulator [Roseivivax isoporae LMG 25204]
MAPAEHSDITPEIGALAGTRGSNQSGMRAHNERLVLSLVRRHGGLAKADIARATGLSAQTVSVIMRALEADGLLVKGAPVRGRVGQPSVPMRLAADGAFFFGLKVGRRSADLILTDFLGEVVARTRTTYRYPDVDATLRFATRGMAELAGALPAGKARRIAGLGIAMPFLIWDWARIIGVEPGRLDDWRHRDLRQELADNVDMPVFLQNDATAACGAELVFGDPVAQSDFLYFFVGYFIGGGLVLNGNVFSGHTGNAGALGSMPVPGPDGSRQLLDAASLSVLETMVEARGGSAGWLWEDPDLWELPEDTAAAWIEDAAQAMAHAIAASISLVDFDLVMIDGWLPSAFRTRLTDATRAALARMNLAGLNAPSIVEGTVGPDARTLGAASLPLSERYLIDSTAFLKQV